MKVLWITNFPLPDACKAIGIPPHKGGSWMNSLAKLINDDANIELYILSFYNNIEFTGVLNGVSYIILPNNIIENKALLIEKYCKISKEIKPNLVHIHGTENIFGLYFLEVCPNVKSVVSIQGLVEIYSRYFYASIKYEDLIKNTSFIELLRKNTFYHQKKSFVLRGTSEKKYFKKADMILGRTSWDYAHSKNFNKNVKYRNCNESLRDEFYLSKKWNIKNKINYSIFVSQASYPIKGFHILLQAIGLLIEEFPQISIRVAGESFTRKPTIKDKLKVTGYWYGKLIYSLTKKYNLNIEFLGVLEAEQMVNEYLRAHCFILPSSIENSPNSLGEAQLLGTPVISTYVGGIPDMVQNEQTGFLYRFEEPEMLANCIRKLFLNDDLANDFSNASIKVAEERHSRKKIKIQLLSAYDELLKS